MVDIQLVGRIEAEGEIRQRVRRRAGASLKRLGLNSSYAPIVLLQQSLNFLPDPHEQGSLRPIFGTSQPTSFPDLGEFPRKNRSESVTRPLVSL